MIALAVALGCATVLGLWRDARAFCDRLVTLRERRLDADLATEARQAAERERASRAMRAAVLPDDLEVLASEWGEHADSVRRRAQEVFATVRDDVATDEEAWQRVRVVLTMEGSAGLGGMEVWS